MEKRKERNSDSKTFPLFPPFRCVVPAAIHAAGLISPPDGGVSDGVFVRPSARPPVFGGPITLLAARHAVRRSGSSANRKRLRPSTT